MEGWVLRKHRVPTSINDLAVDTLLEIIRRLDIKRMVSCRCVSKLWCKLISTECLPSVISNPIYGLVFVQNLDQPPYSGHSLSLARVNSPTCLVEDFCGKLLPFRPSWENLFDCCNGLLLFFDASSMTYYVCNPSTEECVSIPRESHPNPNVPRCGALIFDPYYRIIDIGVRISSMRIYCSLTRSWCWAHVKVDSWFKNHAPFQRFIYLDGYLYRLYRPGRLLAIYVKQGNSRGIELPKVVGRDRELGGVGVSLGSLHYSWYDEQRREVSVWMLSHTDEWILKHVIPNTSTIYPWFGVFAYHPTSDVLFVGCTQDISSYDPETKSSKFICRLREGQIIYNREIFVFPFSVKLKRAKYITA